MKRYILSAILAVTAVALVLMPRPAAAAEELSFAAVINSFTFVGFQGPYTVFEDRGTGTVVGNYTAETGVHFSKGSTRVRGWFNITASNGDLLYLVLEQAGSFATGYWEGPYTIVGGTGRFADATGGGTIVVSSNPDGSPAAGSLVGTISF